MTDIDLDELRDELSEFAQPTKAAGRSPREERVIAGFEEIQRFVEQHGRVPQHGEDRDIFERLYAVRLDRLKALPECRVILEPLDNQGLLSASPVVPASDEEIELDTLAEELKGAAGEASITELRHVRSSTDKRAAEEIAQRDRCEDFERFKPLFAAVERDLATGVRTSRPIVRDAGFLKADITQGQFFIVGGQMAYVAEVGELERAPNGETDARLRVIYSNGTQSNLLRRSLQRALYKDDAGRRITEPEAGPLFAGTADDGDLESGTIYVLRSHSDHPLVAEHRELIHKIGVTGGSVEARISGAANDPTYLLAGVDIVATYKLFNINRAKLEAVLHRVFSSARLDIAMEDRFGKPVQAREWFLVPLSAIDEAVERVRDGTIVGYTYDPTSAQLRTIGRPDPD
ncbi:hypothetical protein IP88_03960 [alpha proteobacterium AAP81b]|nr:hypothetical protein IP88_03960 [alpha proteobacterium AAP81b]